jgi:hypothetical protein
MYTIFNLRKVKVGSSNVPTKSFKITREDADNFLSKNAVFWDVAPCRSRLNRRFGGTYRLHLQRTSVRRWLQSILPPDGCTICGKLSDDNPVYGFGFSVPLQHPFDNETFDSSMSASVKISPDEFIPSLAYTRLHDTVHPCVGTLHTVQLSLDFANCLVSLGKTPITLAARSKS